MNYNYEKQKLQKVGNALKRQEAITKNHKRSCYEKMGRWIQIEEFKPDGKENHLLKTFFQTIGYTYSYSYKKMAPIVTKPKSRKTGFIQKREIVLDDGTLSVRYYFVFKNYEEPLDIDPATLWSALKIKSAISIKKLQYIFGVNYFEQRHETC